MDRTALEHLLKPFQNKCAEKGKPVAGICAEEAYPGDSSTSYIIQVKAAWADHMNCSDAIDFLVDTLWETTDEDTRKKVFSIQVLDSENSLHCWSESEMAKA